MELINLKPGSLYKLIKNSEINKATLISYENFWAILNENFLGFKSEDFNLTDTRSIAYCFIIDNRSIKRNFGLKRELDFDWIQVLIRNKFYYIRLDHIRNGYISGLNGQPIIYLEEIL